MPRDEHQTRIELINPALYLRGWGDSLNREEKTPGGTDIINGRPRKRSGRTDYLLCVLIVEGKPPLPLAILEAKAEDKLPSLGLQQAKDYMKKFNVPFIFSTNGKLFAEYGEDTRQIKDALSLSDFPTPEELKLRYETSNGFKLNSEAAKPLLMPYKGGEAARYYFQDAAIRAALEKIAIGKNRLLLSLATGTGKTVIAVHLLDKLGKAGQLTRALFVCDRDELRTQGMSKLHSIFGDNAQMVTTDDPQPNAKILVSTYQTLNITADDDEPKFWKENFPKNYFSHIILDECHRSARGKWSVILTDNPDAVHIGLTATPRIVVGGKKGSGGRNGDEEITAHNLKYFGEPVYEYSIGTGQDDGYLAACEVIRRTVDLDKKWCKKNMQKPREWYAFQCTGNPDLRPSADKLIPDFRGSKNSHYIAATVDLLSTGVDIPNLGNVVFFRYLESPISFYQMVGRGTRNGEPRGSKLMFRLYDYTNATRLFGEEFKSHAKPSKPDEPLEGVESPTPSYGDGKPKRKIIRVGEQQFTIQIEGEGRSILCEENGKEVLVPLEEYKQTIARQFEKDGIEELEITNLFDETEVWQAAGLMRWWG
ncbi:MAG: DEAD/DEAH box helicase family protein [Candidatus Methanoperedens sp.]|nr:DEAD/DEAH box helicase family protein [Candidatus Methanoperedens sp.]